MATKTSDYPITSFDNDWGANPVDGNPQSVRQMREFLRSKYSELSPNTHTHAIVSTTAAGMMSAADKKLLDSISDRGSITINSQGLALDDYNNANSVGRWIVKCSDSYFLLDIIINGSGQVIQQIYAGCDDPNESYYDSDNNTCTIWRRVYSDDAWKSWSRETMEVHPYGGVISNATVESYGYPASVDAEDILYCTDLGLFVARVNNLLGVSKFYTTWLGCDSYNNGVNGIQTYSYINISCITANERSKLSEVTVGCPPIRAVWEHNNGANLYVETDGELIKPGDTVELWRYGKLIMGKQQDGTRVKRHGWQPAKYRGAKIPLTLASAGTNKFKVAINTNMTYFSAFTDWNVYNQYAMQQGAIRSSESGIQTSGVGYPRLDRHCGLLILRNGVPIADFVRFRMCYTGERYVFGIW